MLHKFRLTNTKQSLSINKSNENLLTILRPLKK